MRLDHEDVMAVARSKGLRTLDGIKYAILERVGTISIIAKSDEGKTDDMQDTDQSQDRAPAPTPEPAGQNSGR